MRLLLYIGLQQLNTWLTGTGKLPRFGDASECGSHVDCEKDLNI